MNELDIFSAASDLTDPAERGRFLDEACRDCPELRQRVDALLSNVARASQFLESPAPGFKATLDQTITEQPGTMIGPYKLLEPIGEGGMGIVYMSEQTTPVRRRVAVKIIKPGMDSRQVIARFEAERQALAIMDHPHIARVLDAGTTDTARPYFVMELVKGIPITKYCDQHQLTPRERLQLFIPVCQALHHAHQKGVIHRDIKPSNVLVAHYDQQPVPKIIDFGVAKALHQPLTEKTMFTGFGQIVGTMDYMSPEQARLNQLDVDTRSDIYSLGVLLYELLTGTTPFDHEQLRQAGLNELCRIIREEEPSRPSARISTLNDQALSTACDQRRVEPRQLALLYRGELDWVVMKALDKERARRYDTADKLAQDIQHYLRNEPVEACPPSTAYRLRKFAGRNKAAIFAAFLITGSLLGGISVATWQAVVATRERERARAAEQQALSELQRADEQADIANAVRDFLQKDLLGMARSDTQVTAGITPDPNITIRTALDRAAENIDERFTLQPLVEAAIRSTIGTTFDSLGEYERATHHHQRAVQLYRQVSGDEHPDTLSSLSNLADNMRLRGKSTEAVDLNREILKLRQESLGTEHPETLVQVNRLAATIFALNPRQPQEAEQLLRRALRVQERVCGEEHPVTVAMLNNLALAINGQRRPAEAEPLFRRVLETRQRLRGNEAPEVLDAMSNLAVTLLNQQHYAEAEELARRAVESRKHISGPEHPQALMTMRLLGSVLVAQQRYAEAEALLAETLDILERTVGRSHPYTEMTRQLLVKCYANQAWNSSTSEVLADRDPDLALQKAQTLVGIAPADANAQATLGVALYRNHEYSAAVDALEQAREMFGGEDPQHRFFLAMAYAKAGRADDARAEFAAGVAWLQKGSCPEEQYRFRDEAQSVIRWEPHLPDIPDN